MAKRTKFLPGEKKALAEECGITRTYLWMILERKRKPTPETIRSIVRAAAARGLDIKSEDFFIRGNPLFK